MKNYHKSNEESNENEDENNMEMRTMQVILMRFKIQMTKALIN